MEPSTSIANLTLDILGYIFDHYAKTETISHPLETLLLVCRSWSDAALGHRVLWSHFNIHLSVAGPYASTRIWKARLPQRLKRCGDKTPLHIDLRHSSVPSWVGEGDAERAYFESFHRVNRSWDCPDIDDPTCTCIRDSILCVDDFLLLLAGENGDLCRRWKSLRLDVRNPVDYGLDYKHFGAILHQTVMPILTSLSIHGLDRWKERITFPHTHLLQHLTVVNSSTSLPSLHTVRSLTIVENPSGLFLRPTSMIGLEEARDVEELVIEGNFRLSKSMPKLWKLKIAGALSVPNNEAVQFPNLTHLTLKSQSHTLHQFKHLFQHRGIDFSRLASFGVHGDPNPFYNKNGFINDVLEILQTAPNLSIIHGNSTGIAIVLKLIWESETESNELTADNRKRGRGKERLLGGQRIVIEKGQESVQLLGDETRDELRDVAAAQLEVDSPEQSWDRILKAQ